MKVGFVERWSGSSFLLDDPTHPFATNLNLTLHAQHLRGLVGEQSLLAEGTIDASPLTPEVRIEGDVAAAWHDRRIRYELWFASVDGVRYRLLGEKELAPMWPLASFTTLPASIYEGTKEIARTKLSLGSGASWTGLLRNVRLEWGRTR